MTKCPLQLQRLRIALQCYDLTVKCKPGTQLYFADALSRSVNTGDDIVFQITESEIAAHVDLITCSDSISPTKFREITEVTNCDVKLQELLKVIWDGHWRIYPGGAGGARPPWRLKIYFLNKPKLIQN